jgi:hypothetical protein
MLIKKLKWTEAKVWVMFKDQGIKNGNSLLTWHHNTLMKIEIPKVNLQKEVCREDGFVSTAARMIRLIKSKALENSEQGRYEDHMVFSINLETGIPLRWNLQQPRVATHLRLCQ